MDTIRSKRFSRSLGRGLSHKSSLAICAALALSVSGCAVGPDFVASAAPEVNGYTPETLAKQTNSANIAGGASQHFVPNLDIPGQWWTLFHSKALNSMIEAALANNHDLKAAQAALRVTQEAVQAQKGFFYPTVIGNAEANRQLTPTGTLAPLLNNNSSLFNLVTPQVTVAYTPDVFGLNQRAVESLQAQADIQRFQVEATYLTLTSNLVLGAVQEASIRGQIAATHKIIDLELKLVEMLRRERALGQAAEADVAVQEAALAQAQAALPILEKQLAQQRDLLTALTGRLPSEQISETFELSSLHLPEKLPVSLPASLVWQRPDLRAADENLHSASALIGVAIANRLPNVTISGNAGTTATTVAALFVPGNTFWEIGANLTQPIFDGGTLMHREAGAKAAYDQAAEQYKSAVVTAFQNVADSLRAIQHDSDALKVSLAAEQAAAKSLRIATGQFKLGMVANIVVLNAQQTYQTAEVSLVQAQAMRYSDTAALFQALGGGWWNRTDVSAAFDAQKAAGPLNLDLAHITEPATKEACPYGSGLFFCTK